ncbi:hypothetical protein [Halobaculum lipolyticum]|uniref:Integral membrane protein n=1 Tax=Halobaculum lipolyticum TaxID=3032001 RepID=A0ABD5WC03_9EURY|nr:hypothetical protein [Halobaculum sp. DT31]
MSRGVASVDRRVAGAGCAVVAGGGTLFAAGPSMLFIGSAVAWGVVGYGFAAGAALWGRGESSNRTVILSAVLGSLTVQTAVSFADEVGAAGGTTAALAAFVLGVLLAGAVAGAAAATDGSAGPSGDAAGASDGSD